MAYIKTQKEIKSIMDYFNLVNSVINRLSQFTKQDILKYVRDYSYESDLTMPDEELGEMIDDSVDLLCRMGAVNYQNGKFKWRY